MQTDAGASSGPAAALSVVLPTLGRERVLLDTLRNLLDPPFPALEILVVDQTPEHEPETAAALAGWVAQGRIRHLRRPVPGVVAAMNQGLREARAPVVLFLDDDMVRSPELFSAHLSGHRNFPGAWAVAGQVLQPGEEPADLAAPEPRAGLCADLAFPFRSTRPDWVANVMAGNLSVKKDRALAIGGFDEGFPPPVSYRFETDFARRLLAAGGRIRFEPLASIRHLRAPSGGTRTLGRHLTSASPLHGVGDSLFALRHGRGVEKWVYLLSRPFREVCTRFHLRHPWWIPVKLLGEFRALRMGLALHRGKGQGERA